MTSEADVVRLVGRVAAPIAALALSRCASATLPKRTRRDLEDLSGMLAELERGEMTSLDRGFAYGLGGALADLAQKAKGREAAPLLSAGQALYALDTLLDARGGNAHVTAEEALVSGLEILAAAVGADPAGLGEAAQLVATHDVEQRLLEVETRLALLRFAGELVKARSEETLQGIALVTDDTLATLSALACTDASSRGASARWLPAEWTLGDSSGCFELASTLLRATHDAHRAQLGVHRRRSFETLVRAMETFVERGSWLRPDGSQVPLRRGVLFVVLCTDPSEESERWSLDAAERLSAPEIAAAYRAAILG